MERLRSLSAYPQRFYVCFLQIKTEDSMIVFCSQDHNLTNTLDKEEKEEVTASEVRLQSAPFPIAQVHTCVPESVEEDEIDCVSMLYSIRKMFWV